MIEIQTSFRGRELASLPERNIKLRFRNRIRIRFWASPSTLGYDKVARLKKSSDKTAAKCVNRRAKKKKKKAKQQTDGGVQKSVAASGGGFVLVLAVAVASLFAAWPILILILKAIPLPPIVTKKWHGSIAFDVRPTMMISDQGLEPGLGLGPGLGFSHGLPVVKLGRLIIHSSGKCHLNRDARRRRWNLLNWSAAPAMQWNPGKEARPND